MFINNTLNKILDFNMDDDWIVKYNIMVYISKLNQYT